LLHYLLVVIPLSVAKLADYPRVSLCNEISDITFKEIPISYCTLSDNAYTPGFTFELFHISRVAADICTEFVLPEFGIALRITGKLAPLMSVPVAPMRKSAGAPFRQQYIRSRPPYPLLKSETKTKIVEVFSHEDFRFRILISHARHHPTFLLGR
jgi:hypothetical protein